MGFIRHRINETFERKFSSFFDIALCNELKAHFNTMGIESEVAIPGTPGHLRPGYIEWTDRATLVACLKVNDRSFDYIELKKRQGLPNGLTVEESNREFLTYDFLVSIPLNRNRKHFYAGLSDPKEGAWSSDLHHVGYGNAFRPLKNTICPLLSSDKELKGLLRGSEYFDCGIRIYPSWKNHYVTCSEIDPVDITYNKPLSTVGLRLPMALDIEIAERICEIVRNEAPRTI